jgi:hypothetical protein
MPFHVLADRFLNQFRHGHIPESGVDGELPKELFIEIEARLSQPLRGAFDKACPLDSFTVLAGFKGCGGQGATFLARHRMTSWQSGAT